VDEAFFVAADRVEAGDAGDVDEGGDALSLAAFQLQQQVAAAGDDAGGLAVLGQQGQRGVQVGGDFVTFDLVGDL